MKFETGVDDEVLLDEFLPVGAALEEEEEEVDVEVLH